MSYHLILTTPGPGTYTPHWETEIDYEYCLSYSECSVPMWADWQGFRTDWSPYWLDGKRAADTIDTLTQVQATLHAYPNLSRYVNPYNPAIRAWEAGKALYPVIAAAQEHPEAVWTVEPLIASGLPREPYES